MDEEQPFDVNLSDEAALTAVLQQALLERAPPRITPQNPHAWDAYVQRHAEDLRRWLTG